MQQASPLHNFDETPAPGGGVRFAITLAITALLLVGVILGMRSWMGRTPTEGALGPEQLKYPEKRPFR